VSSVLLCVLVGADELADVQRDDVRILLAANVILGDLGAGEDEQIVEAARPARFRLDVVEIRLEPFRRHRELAPSERHHPAGAGEHVALHQNVIGDRDDVEAPGLAVEIDHLAQ